MMHLMSNRVALVTGGSSGIGEDAARRLREADFEVYAVARRVERMAELERHGVTVFGMDVTDDASMVSAASSGSSTSAGGSTYS